MMRVAEWLASDDPVLMLESMPVSTRDRKLRLFGCALCHHFEDSLRDGPFVETVTTAEHFADGKTTKAALKRARQSVRAVRHELPDSSTKDRVEWVALWLSEVAASENAFGRVVHQIQQFDSDGLLKRSEQPPAAKLLRCIVCNPFRSISIDAQWQTSEVVALAQAIYDEAAFDRLPQLAKELKNAGCTDKDILKHCRSKGPHVRGCWVVDPLLGKT
jgi:hypothetical protein